MTIRRFIISFVLLLTICFGAYAEQGEGCVVVGAERLPEYIHLLEGRRVGVLANHTSRIGGRHLVDTLLASGVDVKLIFAPERGFRGDGVERHRDSYLGIEILTLRNSPRANDVYRCDVIVCDLQDVGIRTSSPLRALVRLMGVCADIGVPLLILDRPNPNGMYVDGAIVERQYRTSEDVLPLPLVHGMTLGELARMINGQGWLARGAKCPITVVPCIDYQRTMHYELPVAPVPNLSTPADVALLPTRSLLEAFGVVPERGDSSWESVVAEKIDLQLVLLAWQSMDDKSQVDWALFDSVVGAGYVRDMIEMDYTASEIESMWSGDVERFLARREEYLIYED